MWGVKSSAYACIAKSHIMLLETVSCLHEFGGCWSRLSHVLRLLRQACKASGRCCSCFLFAVQFVVSNNIAIKNSHPSCLSTSLTTKTSRRPKKSPAQGRRHRSPGICVAHGSTLAANAVHAFQGNETVQLQHVARKRCYRGRIVLCIGTWSSCNCGQEDGFMSKKQTHGSLAA